MYSYFITQVTPQCDRYMMLLQPKIQVTQYYTIFTKKYNTIIIRHIDVYRR